MKKENPQVIVGTVDLIDNFYKDNLTGEIYSSLKLIEHSKQFPVFDLPLAGLCISSKPWELGDIRSFCHHVIRMKKTDSKHPIILDSDGYVCDGWHRIADAIIKGKTTIEAIRLETMPDPDRIEKD